MRSTRAKNFTRQHDDFTTSAAPKRASCGSGAARQRRTDWVSRLCCTLFTLCALLGPLLGAARAEFPVARLKSARPPVEASRAGRAFSALRARSLLYLNTVVRTRASGAADLVFTNGTLVAIKRGSRLSIERPPSPSSPLILRVAGAFSEVFVRPRGNTIVRTNAAIAAARGTEFLVRLLDENTTEIVVTEGSVEFSNPFASVLVQAGQASRARVGSAPTPPRAVDVTGQLEWTGEVTGLPLELPLAASDSPALRDALAQTSEPAQSQALQVLAQAPGAAGARALSALGLLELRGGRLSESQEYLRQAIARDAALATPRALLSIGLLSQNQIEPALAQARDAVRLSQGASNGERSLAHTALAHALFFANRSDEALRQAGRAVALSGGESDPLSPLALLVQGRVLLARNRPDQALEAFAQASALAPNLFLAQREVGASYASRGQLPRAEIALRRAIVLRPDDASAHALLGDVLARGGRRDESRREFERALAIEPRNALARTLLAQSLLEQGQLKAARAQLEQARADDPEAGLALVRLSEEALYRQDLGASLEFARRGVAALPLSARAHYQLGRAFFEAGRVASAESEFRQAVTLDGNFDQARYALGLARERTERGLLSVLDSVNGAGQRTVGSVGSSLSLQNLQTPGADDRLQAIAGDPTSVRQATRAFGDLQLEGAAGSSRQDGGLSFLRQSEDRRGLIGLNAERQDDTVRDGVDRRFERAGFLLGRKASGSTSGGFVQGEFERSRQGQDTLFQESPSSRSLRFGYELPRLLAGYNFQSRADARTRLLVQGQRLDQNQFDLADPVFDQRFRDRSLNFEARHDRGLGQSNQLSAGVAIGRRTRDNNSTLPFLPGLPPATSQVDFQVRQAQAWARNTFALSPRLSLAGEMRLLNLDYQSSSLGLLPGFPPISREEEASFTAGVPLLVAAYQLDKRSALRLRARRLIASVRDFELLLPNDPFSLASEELPGTNFLGIGATGRSVELEYDRTFSNSSLLRVTLAQQDLRNATLPLGSDIETIDRGRNRVLRASYETPLTRSLSLFSSLDVISAKDESRRARVDLLPRATFVGGLQYLNRSGLFADLLGAYVSENTFIDTSTVDSVPRREDGFDVFTARVGKRIGLRGSVYLEARNLFDKPHARFNKLQPGRTVRLGVVSRF